MRNVSFFFVVVAGFELLGGKWVMERHDVCVYTEHAIKTTGEKRAGKQSGSGVTSLMARCSLQFHTHALEN